MKSALSQVRESRIIHNWNHMDFIFSTHADHVLYKSILVEFIF